MTPKTLYQKHFESIAKKGLLSNENIDEVLFEIGKKICKCLRIDRVNIWMFNTSKRRIECIGNYTDSTQIYTKGEVLYEKDFPIYYAQLESSEIITIPDVYRNPYAGELLETYCEPNNILAMMDTPLHIDGKLAGVLCFENVNETREWSDEEQYFALAIGQIVSLAIETKKRRLAQRKLEKALHDKEMLMAEMHHRTKNNLNILCSMLRIQADESNNKEYKSLAKDFESRIISLSKVHEQLYTSNSYEAVSLKSYLEQIVAELKQNHPNIQFKLNLTEFLVRNEKIVSLGLICNEIITNAIKYAFTPQYNNPTISFHLYPIDDYHFVLDIQDNGIGFDIEKAQQNTSAFGLSLILNLADQIGAKVQVNTKKGNTKYSIYIRH
jgi:two-component sensor histidine kinase